MPSRLVVVGAIAVLTGCLGPTALGRNSDVRWVVVAEETPSVASFVTPLDATNWETGFVVVAILLGPDGQVIKTDILDSNTTPQMEAYASSSLREWKFARPDRYRAEGCVIFYFDSHKDPIDLDRLVNPTTRNFKCNGNFPEKVPPRLQVPSA